MSQDDTIDTWLTKDDIRRIWSVVMEDATDALTSEEELVEFARIVEIIGYRKWGIHAAPATLQ